MLHSFFGLSGTGKTLCLLIQTGFSLVMMNMAGDHKVFLILKEDVMQKFIRLSAEAEPEIYATTRRFGTILENVVFDPVSRHIDLDDDMITENTRCSYPIDFIPNVVKEGYVHKHPNW